MSIILHVSKLTDNNSKEDICDVTESTNAVNLPRNLYPNRNDLSALEISIVSSKYTLSGDDMLSNLSFESHGVNTSKQTNDIEGEIILNNRKAYKGSFVEHQLDHSNSTINKDREREIGRYLLP
jgi:hypothetical protein